MGEIKELGKMCQVGCLRCERAYGWNLEFQDTCIMVTFLEDVKHKEEKKIAVYTL